MSSKKRKSETKSTNRWELSKISSSSKKVKVHSGVRKTKRSTPGVLYEHMLNSEFNNVERHNKWHSGKILEAKAHSKKSTLKIKGFKKSHDGKIKAIENKSD